jgi:hypothetical protein
MDLIYYGDNIEDYPTQNGQYAYGKMTNEEEADYSDIVNLCKVLDGTTYTSDEEFMAALESVFDMDAFLRYLAVVTLIDNWDTYPYTGNNYYLYHDPVTDIFEWIPWDLTWGGNVQAPLFGASNSDMMERAPLHDKVMEVDYYRGKYAAYLDLLLRVWFNSENVTDLVQTYHRMIAPYVSQASGDKAFYGDDFMFPPDDFDRSWESILEFVRQREIYARNVLQEELSTGNAKPSEELP